MHEQWRALEERCIACGLWETQTNVALGHGSSCTDLMFIRSVRRPFKSIRQSVHHGLNVGKASAF